MLWPLLRFCLQSLGSGWEVVGTVEWSHFKVLGARVQATSTSDSDGPSHDTCSASSQQSLPLARKTIERVVMLVQVPVRYAVLGGVDVEVLATFELLHTIEAETEAGSEAGAGAGFVVAHVSEVLSS